MNKCFCHFNGYEVKDAKARRKLEELELNFNNNIGNIKDDIKDIENKIDIANTLTRVVSSKSQMTEENLIYVLLEDNCWYYYDVDSLSWVNGGNFLINLNECDVSYEMLSDGLKALVTFNSKINAYIDDTKETGGLYLISDRYFTNGKFINNTNRVVTIHYTESNYDLTGSVDSSIGLQIGQEFELNPDKIYKCKFATTSGIELTIEETNDLQENLTFKSNLGGSEVNLGDGSITYNMLTDDVKNLILGNYDYTLTLSEDNLSANMNRSIRGGKLINDSEYSLIIRLTDVTGELTIDDQTLGTNSELELLPDYSFNVSVLLSNGEVITEEILHNIQTGLRYESTNDFELTNGIIELNHLSDTLKEFIINPRCYLVLSEDKTSVTYNVSLNGSILSNGLGYDIIWYATDVETGTKGEERTFENGGMISTGSNMYVSLKLTDGSVITDEVYNDMSEKIKFISGEPTFDNGELPVATSDTLGGIKVGENLEITADGILKALGNSRYIEGTEDNPVYLNTLGYGVFVTKGNVYNRSGGLSVSSGQLMVWFLTPTNSMRLILSNSDTSVVSGKNFNYSTAINGNKGYVLQPSQSASFYLTKPIDDLVSNSNAQPLSANQGYVLNNKITNLQAVSLYSSSTGSQTPTLSNSASNYSRIDVELYDTNTLKYGTFTIYSPNGKDYLYSRCESGPESWYLYQIKFTISGTSITYGDNYTYAGHKSENRDYTTWVITKVVGYK